MPFKGLGLHPLLVQATREMRYTVPTPVQAEAIPIILAGRDLIATAQTGTGKTAAFLLPILHRLLDPVPLTGSIQALVITPTRELATQIDEVFMALAYHTSLRAGLLVGGAPMGPQEKAVRAAVEVIVATPGRLLDHMRQNQARFDHIRYVVLDEADRMLDMGFLPDLKKIFQRLPAREQTLLFSATIPPVIARLGQEFMHAPVTISIGKRSAPAVGITQAAYPVPEALKTTLLRHLLRHTEMPSVLVFTRTKASARKLAKTIHGDGFSVTELHSNLTQPQRNRAMEGFRRGDFQILVATNLAARGLDVDHITHVISYDVPSVPDDYIHRIGRTARRQNEGDAFVLVSPPEERLLQRIERQIGQRLPRETLPDFDYGAVGAAVARPGDGRGVSDGERPKRRRRRGGSGQGGPPHTGSGQRSNEGAKPHHAARPQKEAPPRPSHKAGPPKPPPTKKPPRPNG